MLRNRIALAALSFLLAAAGPAFAENKKVVVSQALQTLLYLPLYVAIDEGLFAKHGLDVTKETADGPNAALAALASGKAQFSLQATGWSAAEAAKGTPIVLVANCVNGAAAWIVGAPDFDYHDLTSLKGQTVIVAKMPTSSTALLFEVLREKGVAPDKDIQTIEVKLGTEVAAMLMLTEQAKIAVAGEPATDWAVLTGMKVLFSFPKLYGNYVSSAVATRKDMDPDTVQRFVDAMQEALQLLEKDPARAIETAKKEFPLLAPEIVEAATHRMVADNLYAKNVDISPEGLKTGLDIYLGRAKEHPAYENFVGRAYIDKALTIQ